MSFIKRIFSSFSSNRVHFDLKSATCKARIKMKDLEQGRFYVIPHAQNKILSHMARQKQLVWDGKLPLSVVGYDAGISYSFSINDEYMEIIATK